MHGGKSPGRPVKHGMFTKQAIAERQAISRLLKQSRDMVREILK